MTNVPVVGTAEGHGGGCETGGAGGAGGSGGAGEARARPRRTVAQEGQARAQRQRVHRGQAEASGEIQTMRLHINSF